MIFWRLLMDAIYILIGILFFAGTAVVFRMTNRDRDKEKGGRS
jgi:hypothetical protein